MREDREHIRDVLEELLDEFDNHTTFDLYKSLSDLSFYAWRCTINYATTPVKE